MKSANLRQNLNLEHYLEIVKESKFVPKLNNTHHIRDFQEDNIKSFAKTGFPLSKKNNERWKYLNLNALIETEYKRSSSSSSIKNCEKSTIKSTLERYSLNDSNSIILSDGEFMKPTNPSDIQLDCHPFERSLQTSIPFPIASGKEDPFIAFNSMFSILNTVRLKILKPNNPVNLIILNSGNDQTFNCPRIQIEIEEKTECTLNEIHLNEDNSTDFFSVPVIEIFMKEESKVFHNRLFLGSSNQKHIGFVRVEQEEKSYFKSNSFSNSSKIGANDLHVLLKGEYSECDLRGIYFTAGANQMNTHVSVTHSVPNTKSNTYFKGILADQSRAVFSGKVLVKKNAQKTYAQQKDLNLIMSRGAEIDTKPALEIYADDVQCFHGATAGHVDESTLYYMMSRGIERQVATQMLVKGFADEIIEDISDDLVREIAKTETEKILPRLSFN